MPYVHTADGTAISHTSWGDGPPVLLVHSWGFNADMWTYQVPELVDGGARVVTTDRRGHGRSDRPGTGYDLDTLADDIAAVMARLDLRDVTMVGHSLGCSELVRCLTRHGTDRVSRLVLVAPVLPCLARMPDNPDGIDPSALAARAEALRSDVARWCADNTAGFFGEAKVSGELEAWLVRQIVGTPLKVLLDTMAAVAADLRGRAPRHRRPDGGGARRRRRVGTDRSHWPAGGGADPRRPSGRVRGCRARSLRQPPRPPQPRHPRRHGSRSP